jgi:hypothetical protein
LRPNHPNSDAIGTGKNVLIRDEKVSRSPIGLHGIDEACSDGRAIPDALKSNRCEEQLL